MDSEPSQSSRRALLVGVVAVHLVWCFLEVLARLGQEYSGVHSEELANPWMARMLLEGHWGSWSELRYRSFCGGCGVEATLAVPLLHWFGPRIVVWKVVPLLFHGAVVIGSVALARRWWGERSALLTAALWLGAPAIFLEIGALGWGNHAEVMALVFGALWLLGDGTSLRRTAATGLLVAFTVWFGRTGVVVLPPVLYVLLRSETPRRWWGLGAFLGIAVSGFLAIEVLLGGQFREAEPLGAPPLDAGLLLAPLELARWAFGEAMLSSLWRAAWIDGSRAPVAYAVVFLPALLLGGYSAWTLRPGDSRPGRAGVVLAVGWVAGMVASFPHWHDILRRVPSSPFELRYLAPGFAIAVLLLASGAAVRRPRWAPWLAWAVAVIGVLLRLGTTSPPRFDLLHRPIPVQQVRVPDMERAPLSELPDLVASRRHEPPDMRAAYIRLAAERLFQGRLDSAEAAAIGRGADPELVRDLRHAVERADPPTALDELFELSGDVDDRSAEAFVRGLDDPWDLRTAMLVLAPRLMGHLHTQPTDSMSGEALRFRSALSPAGQMAFDAALGELAMQAAWHPMTLAAAASPGPSLAGLPEELHRGACRQVGITYGQLAVIDGEAGAPTLEALIDLAPAGCARGSVLEGVGLGAWTAGGCEGRSDLIVRSVAEAFRCRL